MVLAHNSEFKPVDSVEGVLEEQKVYFSIKNSRIAKWRNGYFVLTPRGNIEFQEEELLDKAKDIANALGAKVQGDELEIY